MTVEASIFDSLKGLCGNRVFPDVAPLSTIKPYVTYSQIGGEPVEFLENTLPSKKNGRFQFNVWGDTRSQCTALMSQVESALVLSSAFQCRSVGGKNDNYDPDMLLYGAQQDFSIWSDR